MKPQDVRARSCSAAYLTVLATLSVCTGGVALQGAGGGVAAGIHTLLRVEAKRKISRAEEDSHGQPGGIHSALGSYSSKCSLFILFIFFCYQRGRSPVRTLLHSSFAEKKKKKEKQEKQQKLGRGKGNSVRISENSNIFPLTASFKGMKTHWLHGGGNRMRNNRKLEKVTAKKMKINNVHLNSSI